MHEWHPRIFSVCDNHEHRIYADDLAETYAIVDAEDYSYFSRWRWTAIRNSTGKKFYLIRAQGRSGAVKTVYLHKAIHERSGVHQPSPKHFMVDHIDGNSLNCRRSNLRWATPSMNSRNRRGQRELKV